ncbi:MAG: archaeal proteasome endopeptidase complex subunit alpha [Candidatus Aenigmarchaeota archaeon]|nr:archaeal proteasome endopeptidase complex subunit alpha [Candidatus Aenigmarchaeota archaeon]MCX8179220.1 archaeal proteasome endopeptidase complex subunit alpha [Candidatus Aenigmarchaeota archaeon]
MPAVLPEYMGYDRTIAVFSPDGRLFQVEYAKEAVKKGTTSLGLTFKGGVILATVKQPMDLAVTKSTEKLFKLDNHVGAVAAGLLADARVLVNLLRVKAQVHKITYEEPIDVWSLAKSLGDRMQVSTLYAGLRPFGVSFLIGGVDHAGQHLIESDPSGMLFEWLAYSIGRGAPIANKVFKEKYKDGMDEKTALKLMMEAIKKSEKVKDTDSVEIAIIKADKGLTILPDEEVKKLL